MELGEITRPALGQEVSIGTLYDSRGDQFLPGSILPSALLEGIISKFPCPIEKQHQITRSVGATHQARFDAVGIDPNLAASVLCDLIVPKGSGTFLKDDTSEKNILHGVVHHVYNTCGERLDILEPEVRDILVQRVSYTADYRSTHVVIGINYGLQSIISMKYYIKDPDNSSNVEPIFLQDLEAVYEIAKSLPSFDFSDNTVNRRLALEYEFKLYTDVQKEYGIPKQSLALLCTFVQKGPQQIGAGAGLKGYAITYTLLPIQILRQLGPGLLVIPKAIHTHPVLADIRLVLDLFDRYNEGRERLDDYKLFIQAKRQYIPLEHIDNVNDAILRISGAQNNLKVELKRRVLKVRDGIEDDSHVQDLYAMVGSEPEDISTIAAQQRNKINFITEAVNHGASYIGFNGLSLKGVVLSHDSPTPYTLEFNNTVLKSSNSWKEQYESFMAFLWNPERRCQVYIIDCDAPSERKHLDHARFSRMEIKAIPTTQREERYESSSDYGVWSDSSSEPEQSSLIAESPHRSHPQRGIARYHFDALDTSTTRIPIERRLIKLSCPGRRCDSRRDLEWTCFGCDTLIEFCSVDDHIYCDCGRVPYNMWRFKCSSGSHGRNFDRYSSTDLHKLLKRSHRPLYRNILVLGETGVGKSTFINAFYNFLKFDNFDEARTKSKRSLEYVIPCQFTMTVPSRNDPLGYNTRVIRVGSRDDERDGIGGESATQKPSVYTMTYKNTTYRLFDTPGIGDTRGPEQDKENLRGIMDLLRDHKELHGILILFKTNETRMTATFQFCIEELLTIVQRDAVPNIVFGLTHTMNSNYRPGDCYPMLKRKLEDHSDVGFSLGRQTVYSFDAESFRYLAVLSQGLEKGDRRRYRESWDQSRAETLRFLEHVDNLKPCDVGQTVSMDGVRRALEQLMIPMVRVSQAMKENIELLDGSLKDLQDTRLTGDKLRKKLHLQRIEFTAEKLDKPRTVCKHSECCDVKTNPSGEVVIDYKSVCHRDCKLPNVTEDCVGHPGLVDCRAFKKNKTFCDNEGCGHHWQEHMHILYDLKERKVRVKDTEVERRLKANTNDITVRQGGIRNVQDLQRQYEDERDKLRTAMVRFVAYLKLNAITPINDKTENYYNELIKNEENKIQRGKDGNMNVDVNIKKLKGLEQDRDAYLELTETIKRNMRAPRSSSDEPLTDEGVRKLIQELYDLPHFGKDLKKMKTDIVSSHKTTGRERSHRRAKSREWKDAASSQGVEERDGPSRVRERESSGRKGSTREDNPWLTFWRS